MTHSGSSQSQLRLLSPSVQTLLRSGVAITSLSHCVEELLHNALDAQATKILIKLELKSWSISVQDNGNGISENDLKKIGTRYYTSKCHSLKDVDSGIKSLGYRGEAIASIVETSSQLRILSKTRLGDTFSTCFLNGIRGKVSLSTKSLPSHGTNILLTGFMFNMPVRRRNMSMSLEMDEVRHCVTALSLAHLSTEFVLYDDIDKLEIIRTGPCQTLSSSFRSNFGYQWSEKNLMPIQSSNESLTLTGLVSGEGAPNQRTQFIFVNNRLVRKTLMHNSVRNILQKSVMCRAPLSPYKSRNESPSKVSCAYPAFILFLKCSLTFCDIFLEPRKTLVEFEDWELVDNFLNSSLTNFLKENNLYPPGNDKSPDSPAKQVESSSDARREALEQFNVTGITPLSCTQFTDEDSDKEIDDMIEAKEDKPLGLDSKKIDVGRGNILGKPARRLVKEGDTEKMIKKPRLHLEKLARNKKPDLWSTQEAQSHFSRRELNTILPKGKTPFLPRNFGKNYGLAKKPLRSKLNNFDIKTCMSGSSEDNLNSCKWQNTEYERETISTKSGDMKDVFKSWTNPNFCFVKEPETAKSFARSLTEPFNFKREMLKNVKVLGQVDKKFIACKVKVEKGKLDECLVLFDQHAVHERIRLETLIEDHYPHEEKVSSTNLEEELKLQMFQAETDILKSHADKISRYGLQCKFETNGQDILISAVPNCFYMREASELKYHRKSPLLGLVQDCLRDILESLRETRSVQILPKTIFNVLSSQACRSAIKFGDVLSTDQCERMIFELSKCRAPYQCAHGRPSVAPIVKLDKLKNILHKNNDYKFSIRKLVSVIKSHNNSN